MKVKVKDMTCNHCVMKVQKSIMMEGLKATIDLSDQSVSFTHDQDLEKIKLAIVKAGYTPSV
jgi:copper chaperone CopZ